MESRENDYDYSQISREGRIFGSRGRGFLLKNFSDMKIGERFSRNWDNGLNGVGKIVNGCDDYDQNENAEYKKGNYDFRGVSERRNQNRGSGKEMMPPKQKTPYVPDPPTEDETEIFGNGISSGINFDKYDTIEVKVSGENPPKAIDSFENCGLKSCLIDLIKKCKYSKPTPIQKYSIPIILSGRDMMACAQTGSGKTAAFLVPIVNSLLEESKYINSNGLCKPQAVIVSPTRELTIQIFNEARKFSRGTDLKIAIAYGGTNVHHQMQEITNGCHILVATIGRLLDFVRRNKVNLSEVRFLVLDEADRMLDMGFIPDLTTLLTHETMAGEKQILMFSATFPDDIQRLAQTFLNNYLFLAVGIVGGACTDVEQRFFSVTKFEKREKLMELLREMGSSKTLVFVEQKRTTDFIAVYLCEKDFRATSIHGDRGQREREEALKDFKTGKMDVLVATSVAARGLDIKNVSHVVNFDLPKTVDDYVHRIGRTGRVGNRGMATSFFDPQEDIGLAPDLVKILSQAEQEVPDFLLKAGSGVSGFSAGSKFTSRIFRKHHAETNAIISAQETTFEKEVW